MRNGQTFSTQEIKRILATADLDLDNVFITNAEINGNFVEVSREVLLAEVKDNQSWFYREMSQGLRHLVLEDKIGGQYIEIRIDGIADIEEELTSRVGQQLQVAMDSRFKSFKEIEEFFLGADDQLESIISQRDLNVELLDMEGLRDIQHDAIEEVLRHLGLER